MAKKEEFLKISNKKLELLDKEIEDIEKRVKLLPDLYRAKDFVLWEKETLESLPVEIESNLSESFSNIQNLSLNYFNSVFIPVPSINFDCLTLLTTVSSTSATPLVSHIYNSGLEKHPWAEERILSFNKLHDITKIKDSIKIGLRKLKPYLVEVFDNISAQFALLKSDISAVNSVAMSMRTLLDKVIGELKDLAVKKSVRDNWDAIAQNLVVEFERELFLEQKEENKKLKDILSDLGKLRHESGDFDSIYIRFLDHLQAILNYTRF